MPTTRSARSLTDSVEEGSQCESGFHCPFKGFEGCTYRVGGKGFSRSGFLRHLQDRHMPSEEARSSCRNRISTELSVFIAWEEVLDSLQMWLCSLCMHTYSWKRPCRNHVDFIPKPLNGLTVEFLVYGIDKLSTAPDIAAPVEPCVPASSPLDMLHKLFMRNVPTVASIPQQCRLSFSRTLKSTLEKVIANPLDLTVWVHLLLLPICTLGLYNPMSSKEERSGTRKKLQVSSINNALQQWNVFGCYSLVHNLLELPNLQRSKAPKMNQGVSNLYACKRKLSYGQYTTAIKVLSSNGLSPSSPATLDELRNKHPIVPPSDIPEGHIQTDALCVEKKAVLSVIKGFPKGTSCGRDGLRAQHLLDALSGPASVVAEELLIPLTGVVNLWIAGKCPPMLGAYVASAPLTPLLKPGGSIRPIVVATIRRRLCSKRAATIVSKELAPYLGDHQFGVGVQCGEKLSSTQLTSF